MPTKKKAKAPIEGPDSKGSVEISPPMVGSIRGIRRFVLRRLEDASGISGTGVVAEGAEFSSGWCALTWVAKAYQAYTWLPNIATAVAIHGHGGKTVVEYEDDIPKEH